MKEHCRGQRRAGQTQHTFSPSTERSPAKWKQLHISKRRVPKGYDLSDQGGDSRGFHELKCYFSPVREACCQ